MSEFGERLRNLAEGEAMSSGTTWDDLHAALRQLGASFDLKLAYIVELEFDMRELRDRLEALEAQRRVLREALDQLNKLVTSAQDLLRAYLVPGGPGANKTVHALLGLLDGPRQRAVQGAARAALAATDAGQGKP
jgi:hypothetical protein